MDGWYELEIVIIPYKKIVRMIKVREFVHKFEFRYFPVYVMT